MDTVVGLSSRVKSIDTEAATVFKLILCSILTACSLEDPANSPPFSSTVVANWPSWGGDRGGQHYSPLDQINASNIATLKEVWRYRTGDMGPENLTPRSLPAFEATPLQVNDTLYVCSPRGRVIALNPETGAERWVYEPNANIEGSYVVTCRGVTYDEWPE